MKSSSLMLRAIGLPLFTLALSAALVGQQYARRNRFARELKETQAEYNRLTKGMKSVPASASALFSESSAHTHSESEEKEPHTEAKPAAPSHP